MPLAFTMSLLAWGVAEFPKGYAAAGTTQQVRLSLFEVSAVRATAWQATEHKGTSTVEGAGCGCVRMLQARCILLYSSLHAQGNTSSSIGPLLGLAAWCCQPQRRAACTPASVCRAAPD